MFECVEHPDKLHAFEELLKPYGIKEAVRTGRVALRKTQVERTRRAACTSSRSRRGRRRPSKGGRRPLAASSIGGMTRYPALDVAHRASVEFLEGLAERRVAARGPADGLRGPLPEHGEAPERVVEALVAAADEGLVASGGPRYFGYVMGGAVQSSVAADWLCATWDQVAGMTNMSPANAAAEETAGGWILELLGLPASASFGFPSGAQMANFTGLAAGRHVVLDRVGWDVERDGLQGAPAGARVHGRAVARHGAPRHALSRPGRAGHGGRGRAGTDASRRAGRRPGRGQRAGDRLRAGRQRRLRVVGPLRRHRRRLCRARGLAARRRRLRALGGRERRPPAPRARRRARRLVGHGLPQVAQRPVRLGVRGLCRPGRPPRGHELAGGLRRAHRRA